MEKKVLMQKDKNQINERNNRISDLSDAQTFGDRYHFGEAI